jgi:hypothetical protein
MNEAGADNGVDTSQFVRGMSFAETKEPDSDSTGKWEKTPVAFLSLLVPEHGCPMIPYGGIFGGNQGGAGDREWFSFTFAATIEWPGEDGEVKPTEGRYHARIEGKNLDHIISHVRTSRRVTIKCGTGESLRGDKPPSVTSISLRKLDDD